MRSTLLVPGALCMALLAGPAAAQPALQPGEVLVRIETQFGAIDLAIDTKRAPVTSANFLKYVDGRFYDGGRFHRVTRPDNYTPVLPNRPPMAIIQAGINPARRGEAFPAIPLGEDIGHRPEARCRYRLYGACTCGRLREVGLLHLPGRPAVARLRRLTIRRWTGCRGVRPRRCRDGRREDDPATAGRKTSSHAAD